MILTKYTAPWCAPCRTLGATLAEVLPEFPGVELVEVDVSKTKPPAGVTTVPVLEINGRRAAGNLSSTALRAWLKDAIK